MFKIKRLEVTSTSGVVSSLDFIDGLNIIYGPSNSGKTLVIECIDFIFGASQKLDEDLQIARVSMTIDNGHGQIVINRENGSNDIYVDSSDPNAQSGRYTQKSDPSIGDFYLGLLGIPIVELIGSQDRKTFKLTFRTFSHMFVLGEDDIRKKESVLLPSQAVANSKLKAALIYLITGKSFDDEKSGSIEEKLKKKKNLTEYLEQRLAALKAEFEKADRKSVDDIESLISDAAEKITKLQEQLNSKLQARTELNGAIIEISDRIAEDKNLSQKYDVLLSQYDSDVKRMQLIIDGELALDGVESNSHCPFCDGILTSDDHESCIEAAEAELRRLIPQIEDLKIAKRQITQELEQLEAKKNESTELLSALDYEIKQDITPAINNLMKQVEKYRQDMDAILTYRSLEMQIQECSAEYARISSEVIDRSKFYINDQFESEFIEGMSHTIEDLLRACNYDPFVSAIFDRNKFDVIIDGKHKESQGEGYRGFLNCIVAIAMQLYLHEKGLYKLGLLLLDSPTLSLKEVNEAATDNMKTGLFRYLASHQDLCQAIVVENEIPDINYGNAQLIKFTKKANDGRFGFLGHITK